MTKQHFITQRDDGVRSTTLDIRLNVYCLRYTGKDFEHRLPQRRSNTVYPTVLLDQGIPERHLNSAYPIALLKHIIPHSATRTPPIPHIVTKTRHSTSMLKRRLINSATYRPQCFSITAYHSATRSPSTTAPHDRDNAYPTANRSPSTTAPHSCQDNTYPTAIFNHRLFHRATRTPPIPQL